MKDGIFISYRREDSSTFASILYFDLCKYFLRKNIFKDIDSLKPGNDFKKDIHEAIENSSIILVLINRNWAQIQNPSGEKKLFDEEDFVRFEIETGLKNNLEIIPVLFERANMLSKNDLPESLWALCDKQSFIINPESVVQDILELIKLIRSKRKFLFDEGTLTGSYERLYKDPVNTMKSGFKDQMEKLKKDYINIKGLFKRDK